MKTKTLLLIVLVAMQGYNTFAQSYILRGNPNPPSGTTNTNIYQNGSFLGVNTTAPNGNLEVVNTCGTGNQAGLLVTRSIFGCTESGTTQGDYFVIRRTGFLTIPTIFPFVVKTTGRVGIGTGDPDALLDLRGQAGVPIISAKDNTGIIKFVTDASGSVGINTSNTSSALLNIVNNSSTNPIIEARNNTNDVRLRLTNSGNLVIGADFNPQNRFMVFNGASTGVFSVSDNFTVGVNTTNPTTALEINTYNSGISPFRVRDFSQNEKLLITNSNTIILGSGTSDITHVKGKLRVGTQAPTGTYANYTLGVDGDVIAKRVVVQTSNWADHVFADNYKLKPLNEVAAFIKKNKHLPEIPSEKEVLKNGIDTGEMNRLLLQKVEELTLYLIEMKKEIETLKN